MPTCPRARGKSGSVPFAPLVARPLHGHPLDDALDLGALRPDDRCRWCRLVGAETSYPGCWVDGGTDPETITRGELYRFLNTSEVYKCPVDTIDRVRSYSINGYLNGHWATYPSVTTLGTVKRSSEILLFIEELDYRGWNMGSFVVEDPFIFVDYPAAAGQTQLVRHSESSRHKMVPRTAAALALCEKYVAPFSKKKLVVA